MKNKIPVIANLLSYCATIAQTREVFQIIQLCLSILGTLVLVVAKVVSAFKNDGKIDREEAKDILDACLGQFLSKGDKESNTQSDPGFIEDEIPINVEREDTQTPITFQVSSVAVNEEDTHHEENICNRKIRH